jgi:hypothetical protein
MGGSAPLFKLSAVDLLTVAQNVLARLQLRRRSNVASISSSRRNGNASLPPTLSDALWDYRRYPLGHCPPCVTKGVADGAFCITR